MAAMFVSVRFLCSPQYFIRAYKIVLDENIFATMYNAFCSFSQQTPPKSMGLFSTDLQF